MPRITCPERSTVRQWTPTLYPIISPFEDSAKKWTKDPEFRAAYDALEDEFARATADMTQDQVATAMGTTQAMVARLESGRVMPSIRTLGRFAKATGMKPRISFEPEKRQSGTSRR